MKNPRRKNHLGDHIIVVDNISKTYPNGVRALDNFSTKIRRNEVAWKK
ncbi:MAG: hypothetical protein JRJ29_07245 [Deltaproteobacteria bacterium]|nr:hypothetical protein [Deltaproteobacteria bacterium]